MKFMVQWSIDDVTPVLDDDESAAVAKAGTAE